MHLRWAFDVGFLSYVAGLPDGELTVSPPAQREGAEFCFPSTDSAGDEIRFAGCVQFSGYGGMLSIELRNPSLADNMYGSVLTVESASGRTAILKVEAGLVDEPRKATLFGAAVEWFGGAYAPGRPFGHVVVVQ